MPLVTVYCKRAPRCKWELYAKRYWPTLTEALEDALHVARKNLADVQTHGAPDAVMMVREFPDDLDPPEKLSGTVRPYRVWYWNSQPLHSEVITSPEGRAL